MSNVLSLPATESRTCEQHGAYEVRYFLSPIRDGHGSWRGECPQCRQARIHSEQERQHNLEMFELLRKSNIPARFEKKAFATFDPRTRSQATAMKACQAYVTDLNANIDAGTCLVLVGGVGLGKSHLICTILREAIAMLCPARYTTAADLLSEIEGNWIWRGQNAGKPYVRAPLLALDELGPPQSGRDRESLFALLDARYRERRPTLVGSNMKWSEIQESYGERLADRLLENGGRVLAIDGESYRTRQHDEP